MEPGAYGVRARDIDILRAKHARGGKRGVREGSARPRDDAPTPAATTMVRWQGGGGRREVWASVRLAGGGTLRVAWTPIPVRIQAGPPTRPQGLASSSPRVWPHHPPGTGLIIPISQPIIPQGLIKKSPLLYRAAHGPRLGRGGSRGGVFDYASRHHLGEVPPTGSRQCQSRRPPG